MYDSFFQSSWLSSELGYLLEIVTFSLVNLFYEELSFFRNELYNILPKMCYLHCMCYMIYDNILTWSILSFLYISFSSLGKIVQNGSRPHKEVQLMIP